MVIKMNIREKPQNFMKNIVKVKEKESYKYEKSCKIKIKVIKL